MMTDHLSSLMKREGPGGEPWISDNEMEFLEELLLDYEESEAETFNSWCSQRTTFSREMALLPQRVSMAVFQIACKAQGFEEHEKEHGYPARSAKLLLRVGIDELYDLLG